MKRKIFTFAIVSLLSLTVTSCQTETKLDPNDGKELIATSLNKSKQNVIEVINGDFLGADIKIDSSLEFKANFVDEISTSNVANIELNDIDLSATLDFDFQSNYDLAGLRAEIPSLQNSELYTHFILKQVINKEENTQISKTYQNANNVSWYQKFNDQEQLEKEELSSDDINKFADEAIKIIDSVDELFKCYVPEGFTSNEILTKLYEYVCEIDELVKKYRNKEITSQDILNEFYNALGIHADYLPEEINSLFISILENLIKIDISTYFSYTQLKDKNNNIELSASINYESWLNNIKAEFENDKKSLDESSSYYELLISYYDMFVSLLPTDINFDLSAKINSIGLLTSYSYEFLTPSNKLIRKTIVPFLFEVKEEGNPIPKEERMVSVQWMDKDEFIEKCTHENVKEIVKEIQ